MPTSVSVREETRNKLIMIKVEEKARSIDDIIQKLIIQYRKDRLIRANRRFREKMDEKDLALEDLIR